MLIRFDSLPGSDVLASSGARQICKRLPFCLQKLKVGAVEHKLSLKRLDHGMQMLELTK